MHRRADDPRDQVAVGNRRRRSRRARGGSWPRCRRPSRSGCRRDRRSPAGRPASEACWSPLHLLPIAAHYCSSLGDGAAGGGHRRARRRLPAALAPVLGLGRAGVRRPGRRRRLGDRGRRRHRRGRGRRSGPRAAAGPPSAAAARGGHRGGQHPEGRADPPADPGRPLAVHRPHQRRLRRPGRVRRAGRRAGADGRRRARPGRPAPTSTSG